MWDSLEAENFYQLGLEVMWLLGEWSETGSIIGSEGIRKSRNEGGILPCKQGMGMDGPPEGTQTS